MGAATAFNVPAYVAGSMSMGRKGHGGPGDNDEGGWVIILILVIIVAACLIGIVANY